MKQITIQSITLRNWRGEKERTTVFNMDKPTSICGDNGLGKSRHFDAFCWLLFGKDSKERKDFEIRSYDENHNVLHKCECSVEAILFVDGEQLSIKREFNEIWSKPKGQTEEIFKGNITECTWNGVPVKVGDFQNRVSSEIIDDTVFKMITNPRYFAERMKWQDQREQLLLMSGSATDAEIAADNKDFKLLIDKLNGKSLSDFRAELKNEKKRYNAELAEIQPRIDQTQKMMPEAENWNNLEAERVSLATQIKAIDKQMSDSVERNEQRQNNIQKVYDTIRYFRSEQNDIVRKETDKMNAIRDKQNEQRRGIESRLKTAHSQLSELEIDSSRNRSRVDYLTDEIGKIDLELNKLRNEWYNINKSTYTGSDICPYCGQRLPDDKIAAANELFINDKKDKIAANNTKGQSLVNQQRVYKTELTEKQNEYKGLQHNKNLKEDEIQLLNKELLQAPEAATAELVKTNIPEYVEIEKQISKLNATMYSREHVDDKSTLQNQKKELQDAINDVNLRLFKREQIKRSNDEITKLEERGKEIAQSIADIEKREYVAQQFTKKKISDCEQRINGMFKNVKFCLFDYTQDGNEFECCIPTVGGIPYQVANTASQLNAGLDIINTLCKFNNVCAPIFIDGAESVNHYTKTSSQVIFLQVTDDKEIIIK